MQAQKQADECEQLHIQLQQQTEQVAQTKAMLDASAAEHSKLEIELEQAKTRYQALEIQNQLTIEMNRQLIQEKERQEKEAAGRQKSMGKGTGFVDSALQWNPAKPATMHAAFAGKLHCFASVYGESCGSGFFEAASGIRPL